jgi:hypothetical protein
MDEDMILPEDFQMDTTPEETTETRGTRKPRKIMR